MTLDGSFQHCSLENIQKVNKYLESLLKIRKKSNHQEDGMTIAVVCIPPFRSLSPNFNVILVLSDNYFRGKVFH